ncbi:MAG: TolC family protein [Calditrichaeota bacterium]|nr:MAG: TolC family protein [Calditrichota bacterium]
MLSQINFFVIISICILGIADFQKAFSQEILTLKEAVKIGLENNLQIKIVENQKAISENNNSYGNAGFLPKLDASFSAQKVFPSTTTKIGQVESKNDNSTTSLSGEVSLNWTIFDGFGMFARKSKFSSLEKANEENLKNTVQEISLGILQSYFNVVLQSNLLKIFEESVKISEDRFLTAKRRNELGQISKFDLYNAEISLNLDKSKLLQQKTNFTTSKNNLQILLNKDFAKSFETQNEISFGKRLYNLEETTTLAFEKNSELKVAKENINGSKSDITSSKSNFYPRVSAFGKLTSSDRESVFNGQISETKGEDFTLGLTASVNLWNGNSDKIKVQNSKIAKRNAELSLVNLENQIRQNAETLLERFKNEIDIIKIQEENFQAAKANLDLQKKNFEVGNINSLQFRDAQVSFINAETNLITAKYQAKISELEIQKLIGEILLD